MFYKEFANISGKQLAYVRTNDWTEEVILFFHGFMGSKEYFPDIEYNLCILSFDRPGIGESSINEYYTMESFLTNIYDVLMEHNVKSIRVIGHSAGGYYAQVFTQMYPKIVQSLSLLSSMVPLNCPKTNKIVNTKWKIISFLSLKLKRASKFYFKKMASSINKDYDKQLDSNLKTLFESEREFMEENPKMVKNAILNAVTNNGLGVYYDAYSLCQKRDKLDISPDIPVYVWHGAEDSNLPVSFTEYFKEEYNVKKLHIINNIGHMLYLPYWKEIIEELE